MHFDRMYRGRLVRTLTAARFPGEAGALSSSAAAALLSSPTTVVAAPPGGAAASTIIEEERRSERSEREPSGSSEEMEFVWQATGSAFEYNVEFVVPGGSSVGAEQQTKWDLTFDLARRVFIVHVGGAGGEWGSRYLGVCHTSQSGILEEFEAIAAELGEDLRRGEERGGQPSEHDPLL